MKIKPRKIKYSWSAYGYCKVHEKVHKIGNKCKKLIVTNKMILEKIAECKVL